MLVGVQYQDKAGFSKLNFQLSNSLKYWQVQTRPVFTQIATYNYNRGVHHMQSRFKIQ